MYTVNSYQNINTGCSEAQSGSAGRGNVRPMTGTALLSRDRELNDITTVKEADWVAEENATEVTITALPSAGTGTLIGDAAFVCFDPPNDTVRDLWLTEGSGMRKPVLIGTPRTFTFFSADGVTPHAITKCCVIKAADTGVAGLHVVMEAN